MSTVYTPENPHVRSRESSSTLNEPSRKKRSTKGKNINSIPERKTKGGRVFAFGSGDCAQLGLGEDELTVLRPRLIPGLDNSVEIEAGGLHTLALKDNGELYSWGCNDEKALGREGDEYIPLRVELPEKFNVVQMCAGDNFSAVLSSSGEVLAWGTFRDMNGPIGFVGSKKEASPIPKKIDFNGELISKITAGNDHLIALTTTGIVYTTGANDACQLGHSPYLLREQNDENYFLKPKEVGLRTIIDVFAGSYNSFALDAKNRIYSWGQNGFHQCAAPIGKLDVNMNISMPRKLRGKLGLSGIKKIRGGDHHSIFMGSGKLSGIGRNDSFQLGVKLNAEDLLASESGILQASKNIKAIEINDTFIADFDSGSNHVIALSSSGQAYSWGFGESGQLGLGNSENGESPAAISKIVFEQSGSLKSSSEFTVLQVAAGGQHSVLLATSSEMV